MEQIIGYSKKDLDSSFGYIQSSMERFEFHIKMMEEQGANLRSNLDWKSSSEELRDCLEHLKRGLNQFGVQANTK